MKQKFIAKKRRNINYKFLFILFFYFVGVFIGFNYLNNHNKVISNKELVKILLKRSNHHYKYKNKLLNRFIKKIKKKDLVFLINSNYKKLVNNKNNISKSNLSYNTKNPIIYIYNTHQTEEYKSSNYAEYSVRPTVQMADYVLQGVFNKNGLASIVEENKIKEILYLHKWNYSYSYAASRLLMEHKKEKYNTLKYYIDIHRDSLSKEKTTVSIDNKSYASILFIVGLENKNYKDNLEFTTKINDSINDKYPNLSKGIYKKQGVGVNGVYNQDFSPYTILIEIGGKDNTVEEVLNTSLAFTECYMEVILNNEG